MESGEGHKEERKELREKRKKKSYHIVQHEIVIRISCTECQFCEEIICSNNAIYRFEQKK
jgi:NAD-dependent dihydropyrimidine dehydrogenase PreA subunit